ncbi:MAG: hypothetical protein ACQEXJ_01905 [Myxococcota bacterium]
MDERRGATADDTEPGDDEPSSDRTLPEEDLPARIASLHARGSAGESTGADGPARRRQRTLDWGQVPDHAPTATRPEPTERRRPRQGRLQTLQGAPPAAPRPPGRDEERAPRIRSGRLRHVRSAPVGPRPRIEVTRPPARVPEPGPIPDDASDRRLRRLLGVVLLLLVEVAALPSTRGDAVVAPWRELTSPGSAGFVAATFLLLLGLVVGLPMRERLRAGLATGLGVALLAFGLALSRDASAAGAFDAQPALAAVLQGAVGLRVVLLVVACALPGALFWRARQPTGLGPRILVGTGVALLAFAYLGLHVLPGLDAAPLAILLRTGAEAPFLGDRMAAWLALLPLAVAPVALVTLRRAPDRTQALALGLLTWLGVAAPLVTLSLFVASTDAWYRVLLPVQATSVLAAGLLLLPVAAGWLLGASLSGSRTGA